MRFGPGPEWGVTRSGVPNVLLVGAVVGYALMTANGECMAIRYDYIEAIKAKDEALDYLLGAESCGHSRAVSWVAERLPIRCLIVDAEEVETIMEEGTPTLDREP